MARVPLPATALRIPERTKPAVAKPPVAKPTRGKYSKHSLYYVEARPTSTRIRFKEEVARDIGAPLTRPGRYSVKTIVIHSSNAKRCCPALDTLLQLYAQGEDMRRVWIEAAKTADGVNDDIAEGIPPVSHCDCDDMHAGLELHACESCTKPVLCKLRSRDALDRLVCLTCYGISKATSLFEQRRPNETLAQYIARVSLTRSFRRECKVRGWDANTHEAQTILRNALTGVLSRLPATTPTQYKDAYTGTLHELGEELPLLGDNPSRRRFVPHMLTVDACNPKGPPDAKGFKHSLSNLEITSCACQFAKWIHLPGAIHAIGAFLRIEASTKKDRADLLRTLMDLTLVRLKARYYDKMAPGSSPQQKYDRAQAEIISGKPSSAERGPWETAAQSYTATWVPSYENTKYDLWGSERYQELQECVRGTAIHFGVEDKLYTLPDGTLWIGDADSNPPGLDRNGIYVLCRERLQRMRLMCNKKAPTLDDEANLYKEIIFQCSASLTEKKELLWLRKKYGDRLGLPLTLWWNSPLRLSIAHRRHGFGMLTGWPITSMSNVHERIANDENNNLLIESWYVNCSKQDMAEDYYEALDTILRNARVDKSRYNPDLAAAAGDSSAFAGLSEIETEDQYAGVGFDLETSEAESSETDGLSDPPSKSIWKQSNAARPPGWESPPAPEFEAVTPPPIDMRALLKDLRRRMVTEPALAKLFVEDDGVLARLSEASNHAMRSEPDDFKRVYNDLLELLETSGDEMQG